MKRSMDQNGLGLIDWWLSIDFDPVQMPRVRRDMPTTYQFPLDEKAIGPKKVE